MISCLFFLNAFLVSAGCFIVFNPIWGMDRDDISWLRESQKLRSSARKSRSFNDTLEIDMFNGRDIQIDDVDEENQRLKNHREWKTGNLSKNAKTILSSKNRQILYADQSQNTRKDNQDNVVSSLNTSQTIFIKDDQKNFLTYEKKPAVDFSMSSVKSEAGCYPISDEHSNMLQLLDTGRNGILPSFEQNLLASNCAKQESDTSSESEQSLKRKKRSCWSALCCCWPGGVSKNNKNTYITLNQQSLQQRIAEGQKFVINLNVGPSLFELDQMDFVRCKIEDVDVGQVRSNPVRADEKLDEEDKKNAVTLRELSKHGPRQHMIF